jgi:hypothetical protein
MMNVNDLWTTAASDGPRYILTLALLRRKPVFWTLCRLAQMTIQKTTWLVSGSMSVECHIAASE